MQDGLCPSDRKSSACEICDKLNCTIDSVALQASKHCPLKRNNPKKGSVFDRDLLFGGSCAYSDDTMPMKTGISRCRII